MTPVEAARLALTRRILAETQAGIEKAARRRARHEFTAAQLAAGDRWAAQHEKKARAE